MSASRGRMLAIAAVALAAGITGLLGGFWHVPQATPEKRPAAHPVAEAAPTANFNASGAPVVELSVPAMMCEESCAKKVHELLAEQPGAVDVKVDFPARKAIVAVETGKFDPDAALAVLLDHGFEKSELVGPELEPAAAAVEGNPTSDKSAADDGGEKSEAEESRQSAAP